MSVCSPVTVRDFAVSNEMRSGERTSYAPLIGLSIKSLLGSDPEANFGVLAYHDNRTTCQIQFAEMLDKKAMLKPRPFTVANAGHH